MPQVFLCSSSTYGPYNETKYNYWDAENTSTSNNRAVATVKTVYDPCPPDFCIPTSNCFYYIKSSATYFTNNYVYGGMCWIEDGNNVYFPFSGHRIQSASLEYVYQKGWCWTATPVRSGSGWEFVFDGRDIYLNSDNRYYGNAVRAVAEE